MDFYSDLSAHFEDIFPLRKPKMDLLQQHLTVGAKVLDVGCSTGELVVALAKAGYQAFGTDLNQEMIDKARHLAQAEGVAAQFKVGDMRQLQEMYQESFDGISCFGNTVVHLQSAQEIREFFQQVSHLLREDGTFIFQIINYDRILTKQLDGLPTIRNEEKGLTFYRDYDYDSEAHLIHFRTRLVADDGEEKEHSIALYPLRRGEIQEMLFAAGLSQIQFFGNMRQEPFDPANSRPLVVVARPKS